MQTSDEYSKFLAALESLEHRLQALIDEIPESLKDSMCRIELEDAAACIADAAWDVAVLVKELEEEE